MAKAKERAITGGEKKAIQARARQERVLQEEGVIVDPSLVGAIDDFPDLVDVLPALARELRDLNATIGPLEKRKKELAEDINVLLAAVGAKSIRGDDWMAYYVAGGTTETISAELLLSLGVTMDQITDATVSKPKKGYIQVRAVSE